MDFASYGKQAVRLANLRPYGAPDDDTLRSFVDDAFPSRGGELSGGDLDVLRACHVEFREVMLAPGDGGAVRTMNAVMRRHPISPEISDHLHPGETRRWHVHLVADGPIGDQLAGSMAMGLMTTLLDVGLDRRGSCRDEACDDVFLDSSPGGTRRYCSDTCQNRANVAAYRARKRAAARASDPSGVGDGEATDDAGKMGVTDR